MSPDELVDLWNSLGEEAAATGMTRRRLETDASVDLFACIFWPAGRPGLLIEGDGEQHPPTERIPACRGVKVVHEVVSSSTPRTVLQVALEDDRLREIFSILSADLIDAIRLEQDAENALRRCIERLSMWQGLFERVPADGLSEEAQRGLFGELTVLEGLCLTEMDPFEAVTTWAGPAAAHQDFIIRDAAIEVKTALSKRHSRVMVANERQLDERAHRVLLLAFVRLQRSNARGLSLPTLVAQIRTQLKTDIAAGQEFDRRLAQSGYLELHAPLYAPNSYRVTDLKFYQVHAEFPRLTEANLPAGVGDIRYTIIPDNLSDYELTREAAVRLVLDCDD